MIANRVNMMRQIRDTDQLEAKQRVSEEASYLYAPLAHKLGLYKLKSELEDLSLKYLEHDAYYMIKEKLNATKASRDAYIARFIKPIQAKLDAAGLKYHMKGRTKSIHSIWQKMKKQQCGFEGRVRPLCHPHHPRLATRQGNTCSAGRCSLSSRPCISPTLNVCATGSLCLRAMVTSLHTTVLGPENKWVEVQIRTERMDEIAEHGLAAHWRYKGIKSEKGGIDEWLANIRSALENNDDLQLMDQFKMDLKEDEVYVFTPKGDLLNFPKGSHGARLRLLHPLTYRQHLCGRKDQQARSKLQTRSALGRPDRNPDTEQPEATSGMDQHREDLESQGQDPPRHQGDTEEGRSLCQRNSGRRFKNRKLEIEESIMARTIKKMGYKGEL